MLVRIVVGTKRRAFQRDSREKTSSTRIRQYLRPHGHVRFGRGVPADGTCGSRRVAAEFDFAGQDARGGAWRHQQQDKVRGLAAQLQPGTAALESHHCWSTPFALKVLSSPTRHDSATVTPADPDCKLHY